MLYLKGLKNPNNLRERFKIIVSRNHHLGREQDNQTCRIVPKWENKELIKSLLVKDKSNAFVNCRVIHHIIASAAVKVSVKSVVESIVSRYEDHQDNQPRNIV